MKRKTVVVNESGRIPEINISGPISKPTRIALPNIAKMVQNGKNVEECDPEDPYNKDKRVKLTVENVGKDNFKVSAAKVSSQQKKVDTPTVNTPQASPEATETSVDEDNGEPQQNQNNNQKNNKKR